MRTASRIAASLAILLSALLAAACDRSSGAAAHVVAIGAPDDPFAEDGPLPYAAQLVRSATAEGLVAFDAQGRVVPALAERWIVTDDGQSYIFRVRDGNWKDGSAINAKSALAALQRAIRSVRGTSLGLDLAGVDDIRVMTDRVIEIRLAHPMPHLLELLAQPQLGLLHAGAGSGPMRLERVDGTAILRAIDPEELGLPAVRNWEERTRALHLTALPAETAVARFNQGTADFVLGGSLASFPLTRSVGMLRGTIKLDAVRGLFGLLFVEDQGFLAEAANREAVALAIDRPALMAPFALGGWTATTRIVPPDLDAEAGLEPERWADMTLEARRAAAAGQVAFWRARQETPGPVRLRIALPAGEGMDLVFEQLASDLSAIGLEPVRVALAQDADLRLVDEVARYPRAAWFLNRLNCAVQRGLCSKEADALVAQARDTPDAAERAALIARAEDRLVQANVFVPFGAPVRWSLVRGDAIGFADNAWAWHPLMPMALLPR